MGNRKEYRMTFAERQRRSERMTRMNADPVFAEARARYASRRMRAIHAAARAAMGQSEREPVVE